LAGCNATNNPYDPSAASEVEEFKARYLKKGVELMNTVSVLIYDIKGAGRKSIIIYAYIKAI